MAELASTLAPAFEVNARCKIRDTDLEVVVRLVRWDGNELDYYVTWWGDDARKDAWVKADEMERL